MQSIHPTAIVENGAKIGKNVTIGPYCYISSGAIIGDGCTIMQGAVVDGKTTLGQNCKLFYHTVVGSIPQDLKYKGEEAELIIGNNTTIREFCQINVGTQGGGGVTKVGNNCFIMAQVHLGHDVIVGDNVIIANNTAIAGHVEIGNNAFVGGMSGVHQFCKIGEYSMIGGGSALSQDLPPYCLCEGNRAHLRGLNLVGLRRNLDNKEEIENIKKAYKKIFLSGIAMQDAAQELLNETKSIYVKKLAKFVINTKRGIPVKRKVNG